MQNCTLTQNIEQFGTDGVIRFLQNTYLPIEVKLNITIIKHHRELSTTRVQIKPTRLTMVHEPCHILLASIAVTLHRAGRPGVKLETAFGVERVGEGRGREGAVEVEVVVAGGTSVPGAYADFIAPVALEQNLCVLELELVLWVAEVRYLVVSHGVLVFWWVAVGKKRSGEFVYKGGFLEALLDG